MHRKICYNAKIEPTCAVKGYSGDLHCQYCGVFLEEGEILDKSSEHNYGDPKVETYPTCTEKGTAKYTCEDCGYKTVLPYGNATGHSYTNRVFTYDATCTRDGYKIYYCSCGDYIEETIEKALGHIDSDANGYCDRCYNDLTEDCNCNCHKNGFSYIIWMFQKLFYKLFKKNKYCSCGAEHY